MCSCASPFEMSASICPPCFEAAMRLLLRLSFSPFVAPRGELRRDPLRSVNLPAPHGAPPGALRWNDRPTRGPQGSTACQPNRRLSGRRGRKRQRTDRADSPEERPTLASGPTASPPVLRHLVQRGRI